MRAAGAVLVGALCCISGLPPHTRTDAHTPTHLHAPKQKRLYHNGSILTAVVTTALSQRLFSRWWAQAGRQGRRDAERSPLPNGSIPTALLQVAQDRRDAKERGEDVPGRAELKRMNAAKVHYMVHSAWAWVDAPHRSNQIIVQFECNWRANLDCKLECNRSLVRGTLPACKSTHANCSVALSFVIFAFSS